MQTGNLIAYQQSGQIQKQESFLFQSDEVTLSYSSESVLTYNNSMTIEGMETDAYELLRNHVFGVFEKHGLDTKIATDNGEIDLEALSTEEAQELVADDGYFGVEKTAERIFSFAVGISGGDPSRIDAIKEGIDNGFKEALEAFGGWLPDISYDTYDTVMKKLDDWVAESTLHKKLGEVMSVDFFGVGGPGQIGNLKKAQQTQKGSKSEETSAEEKVQFSSVLQDVNKAQASGSTADAARAERISQLKAQVQSGSYQPDLKKVSTSLLQFLMDGE